MDFRHADNPLPFAKYKRKLGQKIKKKEANMFHTERGLYFGRTANGNVRITKYRQQIPKNEVEFEIVLDAESWASTILSVSAKHEDGDTFQEALDFHNNRK